MFNCLLNEARRKVKYTANDGFEVSRERGKALVVVAPRLHHFWELFLLLVDL